QDLQSQVDILTFQAYIGQKKFNVVINEVVESHELLEYRLVLLLAKQQAGIIPQDEVLEQMNSVPFENVSMNDPSSLYIGSAIFMNLGMPEKALRVLHHGSNLICDAMAVHCLLILNRLDLAGNIVRKMQNKNEDSLAYQLAFAEFCLAQGGDKLNEALNIYQELQEKYKPSALLLNGQAVALISMGKYAEAEPLLRQALDLDPNHSESLLNMLAVSVHTGKPAEPSYCHFFWIFLWSFLHHYATIEPNALSSLA
uniref:Coatomer subunit epsilon n=1 Tax=Mesocestoides corti TaxID=53468 RepID=A0A5K3FSH3_MESCO